MLCGADAGVPPAPSNQRVVSELSDTLQLESCLHGEIIKFWGENLSKEELLEPLAYIWMDFREYLAPSYTHNFVVCVHF